MLKEGFLYLHSAEVPKTTKTTTTMTTTTMPLLLAFGRWRQQREALGVSVGPEDRCAKHGGAKPSLERPTPPLFVAGGTRQKKMVLMAEASADGEVRDELVVLRYLLRSRYSYYY